MASGLTPSRMHVRRGAVHLPDFDEGVSHGLPGHREHAAGQVRHLPDGRRDRVVDDQQVVVGVQRHLVGIERAFSGRSGGLQLERLRKQPATREQHERAAGGQASAGIAAAPGTDRSWVVPLLESGGSRLVNGGIVSLSTSRGSRGGGVERVQGVQRVQRVQQFKFRFRVQRSGSTFGSGPPNTAL